MMKSLSMSFYDCEKLSTSFLMIEQFTSPLQLLTVVLLMCSSYFISSLLSYVSQIWLMHSFLVFYSRILPSDGFRDISLEFSLVVSFVMPDMTTPVSTPCVLVVLVDSTMLLSISGFLNKSMYQSLMRYSNSTYYSGQTNELLLMYQTLLWKSFSRVRKMQL